MPGASASGAWRRKTREGGRIDLDPERYHAFRDRASSFEHLGAFGARPFTLTHNAKEVESINGTLHHAGSMSWRRSVAESPAALIPADGETGAERVAVIRESLWRRRYTADPGIMAGS